MPFAFLRIEAHNCCRRAVKVLEKWIQKDGTIEEGFALRIRREIASYQAMSGSLNVCSFYGAYETDKLLYLVTELCTGKVQRSCVHVWTDRFAGVVRPAVTAT